MAAMTVMATSSALAFTIGTDQPSAANGNSPSNSPGAVSALSIRPASSETFTANYSYNNNLLPAVGSSAPIRTMYQQWRHDQQNDWFYLYAQRPTGTSATAAGATWNFYYYAPGRGAATIAVGTPDATAVAPGAPVAGTITALTSTVSTIYLDSGTGTNNPAFIVDSLTATNNTVGGACASAGAVSATTAGPCVAQFMATLRWGVAQQGFRSGSMTLLQAVETFSISTPAVNSGTVYYDSWEAPVAGGANVVRLDDRAPTQGTSASDITNASGNRQSNLAVPYSMTQTVADVDGDLLSQSIIWVFASGPNAGQWFQTGVYDSRSNQGAAATSLAGGTAGPGPATAFYADWRTAQSAFAVGSATTIGYFTSLTVTAPSQTTTTLSAGVTPAGAAASVGVTAQSVTYSFIYSATAIGTLNVYGRAGDWHGLSSGNVLLGQQVVS